MGRVLARGSPRPLHLGLGPGDAAGSRGEAEILRNQPSAPDFETACSSCQGPEPGNRPDFQPDSIPRTSRADDVPKMAVSVVENPTLQVQTNQLELSRHWKNGIASCCRKAPLNTVGSLSGDLMHQPARESPKVI